MNRKRNFQTMFRICAVGFVSIFAALSCTDTATGGLGDGDTSEATPLLWVAETEPIYQSSISIGDDGTIYVGTHGGIEFNIASSMGALYAFNPDGTQKWRYELSNTENVRGSVTIDSAGNLYFILGKYTLGPSRNVSAELNATYVVSLTNSGTFRWKSENLQPLAPGSEINGSNDVALSPDGLTIYASGYDTLWKLNAADGTEIGFHEFVTGSGHRAGGVSNPTVASKGAVYVNVTDLVHPSAPTGEESQGVGGVYKFNADLSAWICQETVMAASETSVQTKELGHSAPAINETAGRVYVGRGEDDDESGNLFHYVYALDIDTLDVLWKYPTAPLTVTAEPVIGTDGTIYVGTSAKPAAQAGIFHAINPDGSRKWSYDTAADVTGDRDIYTGAFITSDGTVWVSSEGQFIYGFNGQTGAVSQKYDLHQLVPRSHGGGAVVKSSVAIDDAGVLYAGDFYYTSLLNNVQCSGDEMAAAGMDDVLEHGGALFAFDTGGPGLADSPWPKFRRTLSNRGSVLP